MKIEAVVEQLFQHLVSGNRVRTATFIKELRKQGVAPETLANEVFWPVHEMLVKLHKHGQLARLSYNYATRLLRQVAHTEALAYTSGPARGERVLLFCGPTEGEELGAQLAVDMLECAGFEVYFGGAGIANDEVLAEMGQMRPQYLVMWASAASDAPAIRQLIDTIREIGGHPDTRIVCGGGVFNRAAGLAEEIGAHATAGTPATLVTCLVQLSNRGQEAQTATSASSRAHAAQTGTGRRTRKVA